MQYDRTIIGYHGCDKSVADELIEGGSFKPSVNDYDWLGAGVYFWEWGLERASEFANVQMQRGGKVTEPAVVGALLQLGNCLDLTDTRFTRDLAAFFPGWQKATFASGQPIPQNKGGAPFWKGRYLDCAVINAYVELTAQAGASFDTVRCAFVEGEPIFEGAGLRIESHVQIAVRNPNSIVGVFRPHNGGQS
jgi:hypothetical protein